MRTALLLAALAGASCSRAVPTAAPTIRLDAEQPSATLPLPPGHGGRIVIEVRPMAVTGDGPVSIAVSPSGGKTTRLSLYPVDRPGRFAMRAPAAAREATVSIEPGRDPPPVLEIQALAVSE